MNKQASLVFACIAATVTIIALILLLPWLTTGYSRYEDWVWCRTHNAEDWPATYHSPLWHNCP